MPSGAVRASAQRHRALGKLLTAVSVELAEGGTADDSLAALILARLREALVVQTQVELVPWGSLQRSEYKSRLVER